MDKARRAEMWFSRHGVDPGNPDGILLIFEETRSPNGKAAVLIGSNTVVVSLFIAHVLTV